MGDSRRAKAAARVEELPIERELQESYLTYAMSVIVARALPDARDGLKPSQRRILVAMNDLNLGPTARQRKCAKICGDTSGNYHPHGEGVIYPTLVRMAQDFNMRHLLIDGQGNFGSIDGYPAAAMRYTEARLARAAAEMLEDLGPETVDYVPNYDETRSEPTVLPGKFPNLIVNGSTGIAVGMATFIPPHNLGEVADALVHLIEDPACTVDDLMEFVKGPDFPTGGILCGTGGIARAYRKGKGQAVLRSRFRFEEGRGERKAIVVTEIPFQVQKRALLERVGEVVKNEVVTGVSDVVDESDREGLRIVIKLTAGADENVVLNQLYAHTQLQETVAIQMIALVGGRPRLLGLKELLELFRDHRVDVVTRRTRHRLRLAEERRHDLEGLIIAVENINEVIEIIRGAASVDEAREALRTRFRLSRRQADVILAMRLRRLTGLEREKLQKDYDEVQEDIKEYRAVLADPDLVLEIIKEDLYELKERYAEERRTEVLEAEAEVLSPEDLVAVEPMAVTLSHAGYLKRQRLSAYRRQRRGGRGVLGVATRETDFPEHLVVASTHDSLLFFTDGGKVLFKKVYELPLLGRTAAGKSVSSVLKLDRDEHVTSLLGVSDFRTGYLAMATERGRVKRTALEEFRTSRKAGVLALRLAEGDRLVSVVRVEGGDEELVLATKLGKALRFRVFHVRPTGRNSAGVAGVRLARGDAVVSLVRAEPGSDLTSVSARGFAKRTPLEQYRLTRRGGTGVANMSVTDGTGPVVACFAARETDEVLVMTARGQIIRTSVAEVRTTGRAAKGVRLVKAESPEEAVIAAVRLPAEEGGAEEDESDSGEEDEPGNDEAGAEE